MKCGMRNAECGMDGAATQLRTSVVRLFAFSLTPALSRWEKEDCSQSVRESRRWGRTEDSQTCGTSARHLHLPAGEGRGEGEQPQAVTRVSFHFACALILAFTGLSSLQLSAAEPIRIDPVRGDAEGRQLAARLREMRPAEGFTNAGSLHLRDAKGKRRQFPVVIETTVNGDRWQATYKAGPAAQPSALTVARSVTEPAKYSVYPPAPAGPMSSFAGTDFWLADLGLDFIHWPAQRVLKHEMRRSEWCWVLESTNPKPAPGAYSRVVSWVDTDSGGIVHADAFDHAGKLLKVFEPKSIQKVNGRWEVKELEIRNEQTDTRTTLRFDLEKK